MKRNNCCKRTCNNLPTRVIVDLVTLAFKVLEVVVILNYNNQNCFKNFYSSNNRSLRLVLALYNNSNREYHRNSKELLLIDQHRKLNTKNQLHLLENTLTLKILYFQCKHTFMQLKCLIVMLQSFSLFT